MIFHENRQTILMNIIPYLCRKLGKMSQKLSSAAVVIGALWVKETLVVTHKCRVLNSSDGVSSLVRQF